MEQFEGLKSLYYQLFNLDEEIHKLIQQGLLDDAVLKVKYFEKISKEIGLAKNTVILDDEQKSIIDSLDCKLKDIIVNFTSEMTQLKILIKSKLDKNKNTLKVNTAYNVDITQSGQMFDLSE